MLATNIQNSAKLIRLFIFMCSSRWRWHPSL